MSVLSRPAALIFDMDGLLLDTEGVYKRSWTAAAAAMGEDLTDELYLQLIGITVDDAGRVLARTFGPEFHLKAFHESARQGYEALVAKEGIPLKPGVVEILNWAQAEEIPCGVGTSTVTAEAEERLKSHHLRDRFSVLIGGDQVTKGKPDPGIFLKVAEQLGIDPARAMVFEDAHSGVRAAVAGGFPVVLVPDLLPATPEISRLCIRTLDSLHTARLWLESLPAGS